MKKYALFSLLVFVFSMPGCGCHKENQETEVSSITSSSFVSSIVSNEAEIDPKSMQIAQAEAELAQIAEAPAESIVSTEFMSEEQVRSTFYSNPVSTELLTQIDNDFYASNQSFLNPADLRLVRLLYVDFDGQTRVGEMIVHENIADDIEEIFYELYRNAYPIQRVILPIGYHADDNAIMTDGITRALGFTWDENGQPMEHEHSLGATR